MNDGRGDDGQRWGRDLLILAAGVLPALVLGVVWMRQAGVPAVVYMQNVGAAVVGAAIAVAGGRRRASPVMGLAVAAVAIVLLLATFVADGVQGVHRWIRLGALTMHVASLTLPLLLAELDRMLRDGRLAVACGVMVAVAAILAMQPDAGQATAFAGGSVVLLAARVKRTVLLSAGMLAVIVLAGLSFLRSDPLAPVAHVEEIAVRIAERGAAWAAAVVLALTLLILPFVVRTVRGSASAGLAVAAYLLLAVLASYWGSFPVPVLGYGMSPILGYFAGWTWLRASGAVARSVS